MRVEFQPAYDLLYVWFAPRGTLAARTETIADGVHADLDDAGRLIGIEVIDASQHLGPDLNVEVVLQAAS